MKFKQFAFRLPSLPKEWYEKLNQLCKHFDMTQWQIVILGFKVILEFGRLNPQALTALADEIKQLYPAKVKNAPGEN
jgi:hypothetical protein